MSRPFYTEVPGGTFHVTSRGNAKRVVFEDDIDCRSFLLELQHTITRHRWRCLAYNLMVNHFHLLVQTPQPTLAAGMRDLKSSYARTFNARRGSDGNLFKARYWRQLVQDDGYLLAAAIYVAQNPVRAGLVAAPGDWRWSSFAATVDGTSKFVDDEPILRLLDSDPVQARRVFSELAHAVNGAPSFDPSLPIIGDLEFTRRHAPQEKPGREVAKDSWQQARPSLIELAHMVAPDRFLEEARSTHRYTLTEIAEYLGCSHETVRRRLRM